MQEYHVRQRYLDETLISMSLSKMLVTDAKSVNYIDGLVEDNTERKTAEVTLMVKMKELARSNAVLEEFAYVASYDLQDLIRMVSSYSSLLRLNTLNAWTRRAQTFLANWSAENDARRV